MENHNNPSPIKETKYKKKSSIAGEFQITIAANAIENRLEQAFKDLQPKVTVKGFRPGKVPMHVVKQQYHNDVLKDVYNRIVYETCYLAVQEHKLPMVGEPSFENTNWQNWQQGQDIEYKANIELLPEVKLKKYKSLPYKPKEFTVTEADLEKAKKLLLESKAEMQNVEEKRGAQAGDHIVIDFQGSLDGNVLADANAKNFLLELGSNNSLVEFQNGIYEMQVGEEKTFPVTYPADFSNKTIAGKTVEYRVKLHEIKTKALPPLTEELAKELGYNSVQDWEQKLRESLQNEKEQEKKNYIENEVIATFLETNPLEVPESLKQNQLYNIMSDTQQFLRYQGFNDYLIEDYLKKHSAEFIERAEKDVKLALLLREVIKAEAISVSDADIKVKTEEVAKSVGRPLVDVEKFYQQEKQRKNLEDSIATKKALALVVQEAKEKKGSWPF